MRKQRERIASRLASTGAVPKAFRKSLGVPAQLNDEPRHIATLLPLPAEKLDLDKYRWVTHSVMDGCVKRGIGILEAISACEQPQQVRPAGPGRTGPREIRIRGDIRVVLSTSDNVIVSVASLNSPYNTANNITRHPLIPPGAPMAIADTHLDPKARAKLAEMARPTLKTARECWEHFVKEHGPGHVFHGKDFGKEFEWTGIPDTSFMGHLQQAKKEGETVNSASDPNLKYGYWRIAHPVRSAPAQRIPDTPASGEQTDMLHLVNDPPQEVAQIPSDSTTETEVLIGQVLASNGTPDLDRVKYLIDAYLMPLIRRSNAANYSLQEDRLGFTLRVDRPIEEDK